MAAVVVSALVGACTAEPRGRGDGVVERRHGGTVFGSNVWQDQGESRAAALERIDASFGPIEIARVFSDWLPPRWPVLESGLGSRPLVLSFRAGPERILSGAADERLAAWFAAAPRDRDTYWTYFHEPEDQVEDGTFAAADFVDAWSHVAELAAAAENPRLRATVILMCWTVNPRSGRDWRSYLPPADQVEVLAWDCYAKGADADSYADPAELLDPAREVAEEMGADWALAEVGARVRPGAEVDRAEWITAVGAYAAEHDARFVTWFDAPVGGNFRLTDQPSMRALAALVRGESS